MDPLRITPEELARRLERGDPLTIVDARSAEAWSKAREQIPGSVRVSPDDADAAIASVPRDREVVTYCT